MWEGSNRHTGQRVYSSEGIFATLTTKEHINDVPKIAIPEATKKGYAIAEEGDSINLEQPNSTTRRGRVGKGVAQTLTTSPQQAVIVDDIYNNRDERIYTEYAPTLRADRQGLKVNNGVRIRKLTPKECWRLQGFPDELFEKARRVNSDSQLYKQAGNSVTVNVIEAIAKRIEVD